MLLKFLLWNSGRHHISGKQDRIGVCWVTHRKRLAITDGETTNSKEYLSPTPVRDVIQDEMVMKKVIGIELFGRLAFAIVFSYLITVPQPDFSSRRESSPGTARTVSRRLRGLFRSRGPSRPGYNRNRLFCRVPWQRWRLPGTF